MLLFASSLYFILGETKEGLLMLVAMIFVVAISIYQETKSSRALQALKQLTQSRVGVIRDGKNETILSEELLPGDIMILQEGDKIPADACILQSNDLTLNESVITGESVPVEKNKDQGSNELFQGSMISVILWKWRCHSYPDNPELICPKQIKTYESTRLSRSRQKILGRERKAGYSEGY